MEQTEKRARDIQQATAKAMKEMHDKGMKDEDIWLAGVTIKATIGIGMIDKGAFTKEQLDKHEKETVTKLENDFKQFKKHIGQ